MTGEELLRRVNERRCIVEDCFCETGPIAKPFACVDVDPKTGMPWQLCRYHRDNPPKIADPNKATPASRKQHKEDGLANLDRLLAGDK